MRSFTPLVLLLSVPVALHAARPLAGSAVDGRPLYARYCSSCHGLAADGRGPVASVLTRAPTDLRRLAERYGRPLSFDRIARWVDGREDVAAHGSREMPVWGERFHALEGAIDPRIEAILAYLATLQED